MCLIEVPAEYKTIASKVIVASARAQTQKHNAEYKDVERHVMIETPKMLKKRIPVEYKTITIKKVAQKTQASCVETPSTYQTVTSHVKVTNSELEWRNTLCKTNTTGDVMRHLQRVLFSFRAYLGAIDGVLVDKR